MHLSQGIMRGRMKVYVHWQWCHTQVLLMLEVSYSDAEASSIIMMGNGNGGSGGDFVTGVHSRLISGGGSGEHYGGMSRQSPCDGRSLVVIKLPVGLGQISVFCCFLFRACYVDLEGKSVYCLKGIICCHPLMKTIVSLRIQGS